MSYLPPPIEVISNQPERPAIQFAAPAGEPRRMRRLAVFLGVFLPSLLAGLSYVWLREPVYQSRATLLTVAPIVIDQPGSEDSEQTVIIQDDHAATTQHVTIQRQLLLGAPLLQNVMARLRAADELPEPSDLTIPELQTMLAVTPVVDTNVVELLAQGSDPKLLPAVVNAWIDAYQELRGRETVKSEDNTAEALREEFARLERKVEEKRQALDLFRRTHDILSKEDADNQALARLKGLNESLNKASDEEVKAKARIDAVRQAVARGEPVAPPGERLSLTYLEQRAQELREELADLQRRYTPEYIALQPQFRLIPEKLRQVEQEIAQKTAQGQKDEVAAAENAFLAARQTVQTIRGQMEAHKREAAEFTTRFSQHEAMQKELADMEDLYRKTQERLLHLEVAPRDKLPQLSVVDRASPPGSPIWPDYRRDSGIALAIAFGLALLAVWLYEFLTARPQAQPAVHMPNIHVYSVPENILLSRQTAHQTSLPEHHAVALERLPPRELSESELRVLMETSPIMARQVIALLLCGLSLEDTAALQPTDIDLENHSINVQGVKFRTLSLPQSLQRLFADNQPLPAWALIPETDTEELAALIACAAVDSGLPRPEEITAEALRHSYVLYLVRQGIRLSELERIVGPLPAKTLAWYGRFSPPGPGLRLEAIQLTHPTLLTANAQHETA